MSSSKINEDFYDLHRAIVSVRSLLDSFQNALQSPAKAQVNPGTQLDPLPLIADASKLIKAQTTKLSLLMLNSPFSPKEVTLIFNVLLNTTLPALMSGLEFCDPERYTKTLNTHVRSLLRILFKELMGLIRRVPDNESKSQEGDHRPTLASTGILWEQCDALAEIDDKGLLWLVDSKVKVSGELLSDAIDELEDWDPRKTQIEDDDDEDEDEGSPIETPTTSDEERSCETIGDMALTSQMALKVKVLKHLRLIRLLYSALRKRRISTFPQQDIKFGLEIHGQVKKLNAIVDYAQDFTELADELACFLYDDSSEVLPKLEVLVARVKACVELTRLSWNAQPDAFTTWIDKWIMLLEEMR